MASVVGGPPSPRHVMSHYFMRSTGGVAVVVVADTAAAAEALAAEAGFPRVGGRPYRADTQDLRAHAGAFRLVGAPSAWPTPPVTLAPGQGLAAWARTPSAGVLPVDQQRSA